MFYSVDGQTSRVIAEEKHRDIYHQDLIFRWIEAWKE